MKEHEPFRGRFWGIFNVEGEGVPIAMFGSHEDADTWLAECRALPTDDDNYLSEECQVFRCDVLGVWWNSYEPDPREHSSLSEHEILAEYRT